MEPAVRASGELRSRTGRQPVLISLLPPAARTLKVAYNTAWFMAHRIREAMSEKNPAPLGGAGKIVEADEA